MKVNEKATKTVGVNEKAEKAVVRKKRLGKATVKEMMPQEKISHEENTSEKEKEKISEGEDI